jgi:hypothetical protein
MFRPAFIILSAAVIIALVFASDRLASAQSLAGISVGSDKAVLTALGTPTNTGPLGEYTAEKYRLRAMLDLSATYLRTSGRLVFLETDWNGGPPGANAYYGDFKFGVTSLEDIRRRFGSNGLLFQNTLSAIPASDGGVSIFSYYEIADTNLIVSFITEVSTEEIANLKRQYPTDIYSRAAGKAILRSVILSDSDYLKSIRSAKIVYDTGYKEIPWAAAEVAPSPVKALSLALIKPSQLPVTRIYNGPNNLPDFSGRDSTFGRYRTRIIEGMSSGPAFAGEYSVIQIGCGTGCSFAFVGSNRTGEIFSVPLGGEDNMYLSLKYQLGSRLLVAQWGASDPGKCVMQFFSFDDGEWTDLLRRDVGPLDACYKSIDENMK